MCIEDEQSTTEAPANVAVFSSGKLEVLITGGLGMR